MGKRRTGTGARSLIILFVMSMLIPVPLSVQAEETGALPVTSGTAVTAEGAATTEIATAMENATVTETAKEATEIAVTAAETATAAGSGQGEQTLTADGEKWEELVLTGEQLSLLGEENAALYSQLLSIYQTQLQQQETLYQQILFLKTLEQEVSLDEAQSQLLIQLNQLDGTLSAQSAQLREQLLFLRELAGVENGTESVTAGPEIIFVGDSRFVQMQAVAGENPYVWIARVSQGYRWFSTEAIPQIDAAVGNGTKIVLNLGVNDVANVNAYARLVNQKAAEWTAKGATVYYSSVNPVEDGEYITASMVRSFNEKLKARLDPQIHWIDSYSYLTETGYTLTDGLHFGRSTYRKLYDYYLSVLK